MDEIPAAPYTGRTSETSPVAALPAATPDAPSPRIRWGRMAAVHFGAGAVVAFLVPLLLLGSDNPGGWAIIALISAVVLGGIAGGLTFGGARLAHYLATRVGRGAMRELGAVALGAVLGSVVLSFFGFATLGAYGLLAVLVVGLPSAIGFGIWVLVAWRGWHAARDAHLRADALR